MSQIFNGLLGRIKFLRIPDNLCWKTPKDYAKFIEENAAVELPFGQNEVTVISGFQTPNADDATKPWFRIDRNNNFLGWHYRKNNEWIEAIKIGTINQLSGDAATPPFGWHALDGSTLGYPDTRSLWKGTAPSQIYWAVYAG